MNQLNDFQKRLLETFKAFDKFCQENDIKYYAAYGTLIGVIRHKGFIPWDDDIDVLMKRKDYNKIISLANKLEGSEYKIGSIVDESYPYEFAKFYSTEGTVEEYEQFPYVIGPWIDIFVLDECDEKDEEFQSLMEKQKYAHWAYRKAISYNPWSEIFSDMLHFRIINSCIRIFKKLRYSPFKEKYRQDYLKYDKLLGSHKGEFLHSYTEKKEKLYQKSWYASTLRMPFEDAMITVPVGYDETLRFTFGDYMLLPPVEKRVSNHDMYYFDLTKKLTWQEVRKQPNVRKAEVMSIATIWDEIKHRGGF